MLIKGFVLIVTPITSCQVRFVSNLVRDGDEGVGLLTINLDGYRVEP